MTRDDIIRMAREAGIDEFGSLDERLIFFAALVAAAEREACKQWFIEDSERFAAQVALAEREACAKVCDDQHDKARTSTGAARAHACAAAIRARGQA
jgi:hypothetical protein